MRGLDVLRMWNTTAGNDEGELGSDGQLSQILVISAMPVRDAASGTIHPTTSRVLTAPGQYLLRVPATKQGLRNEWHGSSGTGEEDVRTIEEGQNRRRSHPP